MDVDEGRKTFDKLREMTGWLCDLGDELDELAARLSMGADLAAVRSEADSQVALAIDRLSGVMMATCAVCGKPMRTGRADARTCSNACRQRAYRQRAEAAEQ